MARELRILLRERAIRSVMPSAMLPSMAGKPTVAVVGAGKWGSALATALQRAGYKIEAIIARAHSASAQKLARKVRAQVLTRRLGKVRADVIWFCVPDAAIASVAKGLATKWNWQGKIALHSSGALTSDQLDILRHRGAAVASVHPMMTFVSGSFSENSKPLSATSKTGLLSRKVGQFNQPLADVPFAIEGDPSAVRVARRMVGDVGGTAYRIRNTEKAAYHAWGMFASPLLTALLVTTEKVAAVAGVRKNAARKRMIPILLQTLANYATRDSADAFSGPIIRGDASTIQRHLSVLRAVPTARDVYVALARAAMRYLPGKNKSTIARLLRSARARVGGVD